MLRLAVLSFLLCAALRSSALPATAPAPTVDLLSLKQATITPRDAFSSPPPARPAQRVAKRKRLLTRAHPSSPQLQRRHDNFPFAMANGRIVVQNLEGVPRRADAAAALAAPTASFPPNPKASDPCPPMRDAATTTTPPATTTKTTAPMATTSTFPPTYKGIVAAYYPDWVSDRLPPEALDFSRFDLLDFAFAIPDASLNIQFDSDEAKDLLTRLVKLAHGNGTQVILSVGGWTGSRYFSRSVSTASNRQTFARNIANVVKQYGVDGVDIDWEYPGTQGAGGNGVSPSDTANFLEFVKTLRSLLGPSKKITACATESTFAGPTGNPVVSTKGFAQLLDYVLIMNYDVWGASSTPGANAPFNNTCGDSAQPTANEVAGIKAWTASGFPASKLLIGVPFYGYVSQSSATSLVHKRSLAAFDAVGREERRQRDLVRRQQWPVGVDAAATPPASSSAASPTGSVTANTLFASSASSASVPPTPSSPSNASFASNTTATPTPQSFVVGNGDLSAYVNSQVSFHQLISAGALRISKGRYVGQNGFTVNWDRCSSTPFLTNPDKDWVVTYDDKQSLALKTAYAVNVGLGGVNAWEISGDHKYGLTDAIRKSMGKPDRAST